MGKQGKKRKDAEKKLLGRQSRRLSAFFGHLWPDGPQSAAEEERDTMFDYMSRGGWNDGHDRYPHENDKGSKGKGGKEEKVEAAPPIPLVVDPELVRAVEDYRIYEKPEDLLTLTKPLTWFMSGSG